MKAIGFNQGQIGDLGMNMIACRAFKEAYPDSHLTFGINKKYQSIAPIFEKNELIDDIRIWENYDNWPSDNDKQYLLDKKFDKVFHPMPQHKYDNWYIKYHHTEAVCMMHDLIPPKNLQISFNRWFELDEKYKDCVALTCFSSVGAIRDIPKDFANKIIDYIHSLGLKTIQLGLKDHPRLINYIRKQTFEMWREIIDSNKIKFIEEFINSNHRLNDKEYNKVIEYYKFKTI
jgi:hypothetical protein